jgi:hypothetical protein
MFLDPVKRIFGSPPGGSAFARPRRARGAMIFGWFRFAHE